MKRRLNLGASFSDAFDAAASQPARPALPETMKHAAVGINTYTERMNSKPPPHIVSKVPEAKVPKIEDNEIDIEAMEKD